MTYFEAYLLTRLDVIGVVCFPFLIFSIFGVACCLFLLLCNLGEDSDEVLAKSAKLGLKISVPVLAISVLIKILIPTSKEAAFIYIAPAIVNNQELQETVKKLPQLSNLGMDYLNKLLSSQIKEVVKDNAVSK